MIFDTGVFIALDNPAKRGVVQALVERMLSEGTTPETTETVLAQAWRDPTKQVLMKRLVDATTVHPFGDAKTIGMRCARSGTSDVVDAGLAVLADQLELSVLTTDPHDMTKLGMKHQTL